MILIMNRLQTKANNEGIFVKAKDGIVILKSKCPEKENASRSIFGKQIPGKNSFIIVNRIPGTDLEMPNALKKHVITCFFNANIYIVIISSTTFGKR